MNEDGIMFLLKSKGYPPHKAFKDAIKNGALKLATRFIEQSRLTSATILLDKEALSKHRSKKDGKNLYAYFAQKATVNEKKKVEYMNDIELLHKKMIEAVFMK